MRKKRIAILTGGGDCPGINSVIRAVVKKAILEHGMTVIGIEDGFEGLILDKYKTLSYEDVSGILTLGGTILGTSNRANPYKYSVTKSGKTELKDLSKSVIRNIKKLNVDCLICVGGDGTLGIANRFFNDGVPVIGVPKTIDNDIKGTDISFGFDSAVQIATEGIDRVHTTAQSHHRVMIIEVMGRRAGWIALYSGVASGGDIILIPEIPYDISIVAKKVKERNKKGKRFSIVVIAEGARPQGGDVIVQRMGKDSSAPVRLGGIGFVLGEELEKITDLETRTVVMGHLQRGGAPTPFDRILGSQLGTHTIDLIHNEEFGNMIGVKGNNFTKVSLELVAKGTRLVPSNHMLIKSARSLGTSFGDSV
ncbi:MAG: ATP-dependent 6-phosphofructokinase [Candidatus Scalindua sp. AMX11]|nr:MAG: ATP-dependent 6-phosphofructokinase [Candidatus Scalindua sp.]NOG84721.1 ATP-dependent 6-phosphofructokinase [Planctomycetota bacterium]RZV98328.1 MAG: ATP-dependent 6-phosphofructokinase [Candidatus Scalindua sp. SCAELEC01]TDE66579.1 MAG: ATP-dependent 6-phosphofructokinase [Candidatus Scalindua sp. AMX11]GJQ58949.1 MAG: ATP-dependent 6-phosphofructokinase [Candidatus Scalindua sp.]